MVTIDLGKRQALPRGTTSRRRRTHRSAPRRRTRLVDLHGPELYAIISYRLAMAIIILIGLLYIGN